jgi:hypothetical protein
LGRTVRRISKAGGQDLTDSWHPAIEEGQAKARPTSASMCRTCIPLPVPKLASSCPAAAPPTRTLAPVLTMLTLDLSAFLLDRCNRSAMEGTKYLEHLKRSVETSKRKLSAHLDGQRVLCREPHVVLGTETLRGHAVTPQAHFIAKNQMDSSRHRRPLCQEPWTRFTTKIEPLPIAVVNALHNYNYVKF